MNYTCMYAAFIICIYIYIYTYIATDLSLEYLVGKVGENPISRVRVRKLEVRMISPPTRWTLYLEPVLDLLKHDVVHGLPCPPPLEPPDACLY